MVSVVVVNWNRRELLGRCLESLRLQRDISFEIIVIDNGSRDGSAAWVRSQWPEVRLVENEDNRGFCAANNQGISLARGQYVALLNNDAEAQPGWLAALRRVFDAGPEVGMAASKVLIYEDPGRIDKVGHLIYPDGQNRGRGAGEPDDGRFDQPGEVAWPDGCAAMYRKSMLDRIGGFDEDFFAYGDDAELGLRARIAGWTCRYAPDAVVRHHRGSTLGKRSVRRLALIERNRVLLAMKLFPWRLLWRNPYYYGMRLSAGAMASARGAGETALFPGVSGKLRLATGLLWGDLQALAMAPRILRKRGGIRRMARMTPREIEAFLFANRISLRELSTQAAL